MPVIYVPRAFGGTLILTTGAPPPPLTDGPVVMLLADQAVKSAQIADVQRTQAQLTDQLVDITVLSEKVV